MYSGQSVLENMHSSKFFGLMQEEEINIFKHMGGSDVGAFRDLLVSTILSTDMTRHTQLTDDFTNMA